MSDAIYMLYERVHQSICISPQMLLLLTYRSLCCRIPVGPDEHYSILFSLTMFPRQNADYIVANDVTRIDSGFGTDTNTVVVIGKENYINHFDNMTKKELATKLFETLLDHEEDVQHVR